MTPESKKTAPSYPEKKDSNLSILIIDDDTTIIERYQIVLGSRGYSNCTLLSTREEAFNCIEIIRERGVDIVFLDKFFLIDGEEINVGDHVLELIRSEFPKLPVFGISRNPIQGIEKIGKGFPEIMQKIQEVEAGTHEDFE